MGYDLVLLDLDGTLLNFEEAQEKAFEKTLGEFGIVYSEKALEVYVKANKRCWEEFEKGLITKEELFIARFTNFLEEMGLDSGKAERISERYMQILPVCKVIPPESVELCGALSKRADIVIATNGDAKGQMMVIESSGIMPFIKGVAVSEKVGYPKPDYRFFQYAMALVSDAQKDKTIIVGDSLTADIKGGADFGIDTCWFNPAYSPSLKGIEPTYIIKDLRQILDLV
ncbi:MAG: YjjG family noncanonical pyrimidine nucleotidase [Defluviitaleaceae bacterium]|nr:YjjG family noncanonical pyrimidine nucleotidase [Defluviitaleaceae bacterium]